MTRDALLLELEATRAALRARDEELRARDEELRAERVARATRETELESERRRVAELLAENEALRLRVERLSRRMFGKSSERLDPGQLLLALRFAEAEEAKAVAEDAKETALGEETPSTPRPKRVRPSEKKAHEDLPVQEVRVDPPEAERVCRCGKAMARIGEETSEVIEYVPASLHVVRTVRGKFACRDCEDRVVIAPPPATAIEKSVAGPGLVAHVVAQKYADHLPLYRQEEIFQRAGADLPRSTLGDLVSAAAERLEPLARAVLASVLSGRVVNTDDTPVTYLTPPQGSSRGALWAYVGEKGEVAYDFTTGRSRDGPARVLSKYRGFLQADALKVYDAIYAPGEIVEVACWAHARRYFFDARSTDAARADEALEKIRRLYRIEAESSALPESERVRQRIDRARPILAELGRWMDAVAPTVLPKGPLGQAISYARSNWAALCRYTEQGFLGIDNNKAERALRAVAVGRKNWLFAGTEEAGRRAAVLMTLVGTCRLQGLDPEAYLTDVLVRLSTTPVSRIDELTPRGWKKTRDAT